MTLSSFALLLAVLPSGRLAVFQCPDGSPPPCRVARTAAAQPAASVAVLDPVTPSADAAATELADGLAEDLTIRLGEVSRLTVRSRATVRRLREASGMSMEQLGRTLSASYLVSLSVRRSGSTLRFSAELTRANNGAQVWAAQYDRADQDLLAMQSEIARAVAGGVAGRLFPAEQATLTARPTTNSEAYGAYLRGLALRKSSGNNRGALIQQLRATALDSNFAAAWSELGTVHAALYWYYEDRSEARLTLARFAAERALRLAPNASSSHIAMAYYYYWGSRNYEAALAELRLALAANARDSDVPDGIANVLRRQGRWDASLASRRQAIAMSPGDAGPHCDQGITLLMLRRYAEADSAFDRMMTLGTDAADCHLNSVLSALEQGSSLDRIQASVAWLVSNVALTLPQPFKDPQQSLPVARMVPAYQDVILGAPLPALPEARAGRSLMIAEVFDARGEHARAALHFDSARVMIEGLVRLRPDDAGLRSGLALALAGSGHAADAVREAETAVRLMPTSLDALSGPEMTMTLAVVLLRTGDAERAVTLLEELLALPTFINRTLLRTDPVFAPLRGNSRFERLAAEPQR